MKKNIIAGAVLTLVAGVAAAQSNVTIYGNIDTGLLSQSNKAPGVARTTMENGGISPSIWGFRGTEDLGNGLKAVFNLESHFRPDTGANEPGANPTSPLFRRQANVGLSSAGFGTVLLGNQYSPAILAFAATDPRGLRENFSGLYSWAFNSGVLNGTNTNHDVGVFLQNAISYSNKVGPVGVGFAYSVPENKTTAPAAGGAVYSLGLTYTGPVALSAAYQQTNKAGTSDKLASVATIGAAYTMDAFTGKLNYLRGKGENGAAADNKVGVVGVGVDWKTAPNNTVIVAAYFGKDKNYSSDKTTTVVLSDEYSLSKRTTLYGQVAFADTKAGSTARTSIALQGLAADKNTNFVNVGVKHSF